MSKKQETPETEQDDLEEPELGGDMLVELARIKKMAHKLEGLANRLESKGGPATALDVATIRVQTANVSHLFITTALALVSSMDDPDEGADEDFDPCDEAHGDCDICAYQEECVAAAAEKEKECSTCPNRPKCEPKNPN